MVAGAANPLTQQQIQNYQNPYTQSVIDATQAQFNNQNAQAAARVTGNSISNGALGGNRNAVGQAVLSGQQQLAQAPVIAGLYNQGYNQALQTAQQQYQANPQQAAGMLANFGLSGQNAALQGANAQIGAGTLQQQTQQAQNNANYGQFQNQQAYPFQVAQWLAQIGTGVGSQLGSTTTGQTTGPPPNPWNQILGLGTAGLGLAGKFFHGGGAVHKDGGGGVGGMPYGAQELPFAGVHGYIPEALKSRMSPQALHTSAAPHLIDPYAGSTDVTKMVDQAIQVADKVNNRATMGSPGLASPIYKVGAAGDYAVPSFVSTGGGVHGYAGGGVPSFDDRFSAIRSPGIASTDPIIEPQKEEEPYRLAGPEAMAAWRNETPLPEAPVVAKGNDDDEDAKIPPASTPTAGVGSPLRRSASAPVAGLADVPEPVRPFDQGSQTAGFAAPPEPVDEGSYGSSKLSKHLPNALLTAGLGMLASRSPFLGVGIGEGGLAGMNAFSAAQAAEIKQNNENRRIEMEAQRLAQSATQAKIEQASKPLVVGDDGSMRVNPAYIEQLKAEDAVKSYQPKWGVIGETTDPDTGTMRKTYGWVDANDKKITDSKGSPIETSASPTPVRSPPVVGVDGKPLQGEEWASSVPPARADRARMIANYEMSPSDLPTRGGVRAAAITDAKHFNKDFNEQNYAASQRAYNNFVAGPEARTVRSLNVAVDHLDTLEQAATALKNGNIPLLNSLVNRYREQTGSPLTTNFDSIKQAVSSEVAKVVVGGQTALADRDEMSHNASNSRSPDQLIGTFGGFKKLMAGQMKGLHRQYESGTYRKDFEKFLEPSTKAAMASVSHKVKDNWEEPKTSNSSPSSDKTTQTVQASQSVSVTSPAQAKDLAPGTRYRTPDGREFIR